MDLVISHSTALRFWRTFSGKLAALPRPKQPCAMTSAPDFSESMLEELHELGIFPSAQRPLHLLFATQQLRTDRAMVRSHVCAQPLPAGSLLRIAPHVLIASPELCFLQMGTALTPEKLALCGCHLCGNFGIDTTGELFERTAITTAKQLGSFIAKMPGTHGNKTAKAALPHIADGTESPMEARLFLLLCLPATMGGYGLPCAHLNPHISLSENARTLYDHATCRCDLFWESALLDVEYDGEESHTGTKHAGDIARRAALETEGITVKVLAWNQLADAEAFDIVARDIAKRIGWRLRIRTKNWEERRESLREELGF